MRNRTHHAGFAAYFCALLAACTDPTVATPPIATPPDFTAIVTMAMRESAFGPAGPYTQVDLWVAIPPATSANAGIIVPDATPVFMQPGASFVITTTSDAIQVGDRVQIWHDGRPSFGAVEAPAGSPTYGALQLIVVR